MNDFKDIFRIGLKVAIAKSDMTTEQLSKKSGVGVGSIREYLRADSDPMFETACKLADALGCTPNDLCSWSEICSKDQR